MHTICTHLMRPGLDSCTATRKFFCRLALQAVEASQGRPAGLDAAAVHRYSGTGVFAAMNNVAARPPPRPDTPAVWGGCGNRGAATRGVAVPAASMRSGRSSLPRDLDSNEVAGGVDSRPPEAGGLGSRQQPLGDGRPSGAVASPVELAAAQLLLRQQEEAQRDDVPHLSLQLTPASQSEGGSTLSPVAKLSQLRQPQTQERSQQRQAAADSAAGQPADAARLASPAANPHAVAAPQAACAVAPEGHPAAAAATEAQPTTPAAVPAELATPSRARTRSQTKTAQMRTPEAAQPAPQTPQLRPTPSSQAKRRKGHPNAAPVNAAEPAKEPSAAADVAEPSAAAAADPTASGPATTAAADEARQCVSQQAAGADEQRPVQQQQASPPDAPAAGAAQPVQQNVEQQHGQEHQQQPAGKQEACAQKTPEAKGAKGRKRASKVVQTSPTIALHRGPGGQVSAHLGVSPAANTCRAACTTCLQLQCAHRGLEMGVAACDRIVQVLLRLFFEL